MKKYMILLLISMGTLVYAQRDMTPGKPGGTPPPNRAFGNYYALLISASEYQDPKVRDLDGEPTRDARELQQILKNQYGFRESNMILLENATRGDIISALWKMNRKISERDNFLIFYAGHGYYDEESEVGYWMPVNADDEVPTEWLYNSTLVDEIKKIKSKHTLIISDACFSGSIFKTREHRTAAPQSYIKKQRLPSRRAITSGTLKTVPNKSIFFKYLKKYLKNNRQAYLSASELFAMLEIPVGNNSPNTPQFGSIQNVGHEGGDFIFKSSKSSSTTTVTPPPSLPDRDGDGVPDQYDRCPDEYGTEYGCPPQPQVKDSDGDGYPDHQDNCPHQYSRTNKGCPEPKPKPQDGYWRDMVRVQGGSYLMGCTDGDSDCWNDEKPQHRVQLDGFYISKYEVTQQQWYDIMGDRPSSNKNCNNCPVENVSHDDIQTFLQKLNAKTGKNYRLPTEAEWEYAARGGRKSRGYKYSGSNNINDVAWYGSNSGSKTTHPVGRKRANELGLYDMSGNVWEWCSDWWTGYNNIISSYNPKGASSGSNRVLRGGGWHDIAKYCRVSYRDGNSPSNRFNVIGFRLAHSL